MNHSQQQYPTTQRRRLTGPFAIFGRGRMLSFVMMGVVSIFSFLSNNTSWVRPRATVNSGQPGLTVQQTQHQLTASRAQAAQQTQIMQSNPIQTHGGTVEDARATQVRQVGARLLQTIPNLQPGAVRFFVLRDTTQAGSYALADGSVLVTAGLLSQIQTEDQLADILSRRMTEVLYRNVDRIQNPQVAQFPTQIVQAAGYRPSAVVPAANYATGNPQFAAPISAGWTR